MKNSILSTSSRNDLHVDALGTLHDGGCNTVESHNGIAIPTTDQQGDSQSGTVDIGADEHSTDSINPTILTIDCSHYVATAEKFGIVQGYDDGIFGLHKYVSRAKAVKIILGISELELALEEEYQFFDFTKDDWFSP